MKLNLYKKHPVSRPLCKSGASQSWSSYWSSRSPYFALPETGVSLMVGQEVTMYGDSLINLPLGRATQNLVVEYTCDIGTVSGNNITFNPVAGNIGDHSLKIVFKNGGYTIADETITLSVYAEAVGNLRVLTIGDSTMGASDIQPQVTTLLNGATITYLGTQGTPNLNEGYSGANFYYFLENASSPFRKGGVLDVDSYFTDNSIDEPDIVYIRLGINDIWASSTAPLTDNTLINQILGYSQTLIDAFLAHNTYLKVIVALPTICENTGAGWNANYDESVYNQDNYINNIHKYRVALVNKYANGEYDSRVDCSYEAIFMDRNDGYPKTDGVHNNGVHPDTSGYIQLANGLALALNTYLKTQFVTSWKTDNAGASNNNQIKLPLTAGGTYDFIAHWGDGSHTKITAWNQAEITHTYPDAGTYTVSFAGTISNWAFQGAGSDCLKITNIGQWGNILLGSDGGHFLGCENMACSATDYPDLSAVTTLLQSFRQCTLFNGDLSRCNVSNVTSLLQAFYAATAFNRSLALWDIGEVTNASNMLDLTSISVANYSATLIGWAAQTVKSGVTLGADGKKYNAGAVAARGVLTSAPNSWTISDGGQE